MIFKLRSGLIQAIALVAFLLLHAAGFAQRFEPFQLGTPAPSFRNINMSAGLPSSECYDVLQDKRGYIWISTDRGVVRYDGFRFQTFTMKHGLADDVIFKLYEDYKGRIWFVSYNGMLSYWEYLPQRQPNGKFHTYRYNDRIRKFLGRFTASYKSLIVTRDDKIYYALYSMGGISIDAKGRVKQLATGGATNKCEAMEIEGQWIPVSLLKGKPPFFAVGTDRYGKLRVLERYTPGPGHLNMSGPYMQLGNDIFDILSAKKLYSEPSSIGIDVVGNELFTGIHNKGGVRRECLSFPRNHPKRTTYFLRGHSVSSSMRDREGGYWFTTLDNGVYYAPNLQMVSYTAAQGLVNMEYSALGGIGNDIYIVDPSACTKLTAPAMQMSHEGLWNHPGIGRTRTTLFFNWGKLYSRSFPEKHVMCLPHNQYTFFSTDDYVISSGASIVRIYDNGRKDTLYNSAGKSRRESINFHYGITETREGKVYIGNMNGIFRIRDGNADQYGLNDTLFKCRVSDMERHPVLKTIVATRNQGIYCFDEKERITHRLTRKDGLLSDLVSCLYVDESGYLYVGTNHGLTIHELKKDGTFRHWTLTTCQGLCSNEIMDVYRHGSRLWISTKKGVSTFDTREAVAAARGSVGLAYIMIDGRTIEPELQALLLKSNVQQVQVAVRTDNFSGTGHHKFRYQLRRGGDWFASGDPEIRLNEPRWGEYQVSVKFRNDSGVWSKAIPLIDFTVEAPFYAEWYFIAFVSFAFIAIVFWIFKSILKRVKQRHAYQTTINQLEQKALRAQMNPHFIFNSLNSIQSFLVYEENEKAERYLLKFAQLIRQTLNNSRESYITIEAEIDTLERYLDLERMRFKDKFDFEIVSLLSWDALKYGIPPMLIQPFVENAVLHGFRSVESGGKVEIRFESLEGIYLTCVVEDNGVGRKASSRGREAGHKSFGTRITAERLAAFKEKYGDDFTIAIFDKEKDGKPSGTKVTLKIPVVPPNEITTTDDL